MNSAILPGLQLLCLDEEILCLNEEKENQFSHNNVFENVLSRSSNMQAWHGVEGVVGAGIAGLEAYKRYNLLILDTLATASLAARGHVTF